MKFALRVKDPFHLDGEMLTPGTLLTDEQAEKVRKSNELRRRCTQEAADPAQPAKPPAPPVEGRRTQRNSSSDTQE